jgi:uncharacterized membrane protein
MRRFILPLLIGLVIGGILHIVLVLVLPGILTTSAWDRIAALTADSPPTLGTPGAASAPIILSPPGPGEANPLRLDPELMYAACRIDLRAAPGRVAGALPQAFWSVAVYGRNGQVIYSTTNRDGLGRVLDIGVFNAAEVRLLAEQRFDVTDDLIVVEAEEDDALVVVRLAPPHPSARPRYAAALQALTCGSIGLI